MLKAETNSFVSQNLFERARKSTPGGVNSSTRALEPPRMWASASGSKLRDADGHEFIDYHAAFGPILLGHNDPFVNQKVADALRGPDLIGSGTTELEVRLAEKLVEHVPSAEMVLLCISGSEATFNAIRLARAVTGRKKIIKFQGCYHGWHDYLCMNVISRPERMGKYDPASAGMLEDAARETIVAAFNQIDEVEAVLRAYRGEFAAIILEPIAHNIGCVLPTPEFLLGLRELATMEDVVLIFDEVITGFRHGLGGYQKYSGVTPDLTTLAKSMANGYPCAALCGRKELMERFQTQRGGDVFFAGTYNGHPTGVAAALATIERLEDGSVHDYLFRTGEQMAREMAALIEKHGVRAHVAQFGSVIVPYFMEPPVENYTDLLRNDTEADLQFRRAMIDRGIFMLPLALKRNHLTAAHIEEDIARTLQAADEVLRTMGRVSVRTH